MRKVTKTYNGFTILELMIATVIVSLLLLLCVYGLAQVARYFTKGVTSASTQNTARSVIEDVVDRIQVEQDQIFEANSSGTKLFCIGKARYSYNYVDGDLTDDKITLATDNRVLKRDELQATPTNPDDCIHNVAEDKSQVKLLKENMRTVSFTITPDPTSKGRLYDVSLKVLYAPNDAALAQIVYLPDPSKPDDVRCSGARGAEFCGLSSLTTRAFRFNECTYCE